LFLKPLIPTILAVEVAISGFEFLSSYGARNTILSTAVNTTYLDPPGIGLGSFNFPSLEYLMKSLPTASKVLSDHVH
jgi:hypothetical protein